MPAHIAVIKWKATRGFAHRAARQQEAEENHERFQYAKI
jgi:hypothetical protein